MTGRASRIAWIVTTMMLLATGIWLTERYELTPETLIRHREAILTAVARHYAASVLLFILIYVCTALFLPGALVLTLAGGMVFGTVPGLIYVNIGATVGALIAFQISRSFLGHLVQDRFAGNLTRFNEELARHGRSYLLVLRIIPLIPFFVVNYGAGLTRIPVRTFAWTTALGMLPGSFIYTLAGHRLRTVNSWQDLSSGPVAVVLAVLALFALMPVVLHHLQHRR